MNNALKHKINQFFRHTAQNIIRRNYAAIKRALSGEKRIISGAKIAAITKIIVLKSVIKVINFRCNVAAKLFVFSATLSLEEEAGGALY